MSGNDTAGQGQPPSVKWTASEIKLMNSLQYIVQFWFQQNCCIKSNLLGN